MFQSTNQLWRSVLHFLWVNCGSKLTAMTSRYYLSGLVGPRRDPKRSGPRRGGCQTNSTTNSWKSSNNSPNSPSAQAPDSHVSPEISEISHVENWPKTLTWLAVSAQVVSNPKRLPGFPEATHHRAISTSHEVLGSLWHWDLLAPRSPNET